MTKWIVTVFLVLTAAPSFSQLKTPGGMSGGGGDVPPFWSIDYGTFGDFIISSRAELIMFFNAQRKHQMMYPEFRKLYSSDRSIIDVIREIPIYNNTDQYRPCVDASGNPVDASIYSIKVNTVCISQSRLTSKISRHDGRNQILALLAHEYSHLIGFSEEEAKALQRQVLSLLIEDSRDRVLESLNESTSLFGYLSGALINRAHSEDSKSWNQNCFFANRFLAYMGQIEKSEGLNQFSVFKDDDFDEFRLFFVKIEILALGACAHSDYDPYRETKKEMMERIFGQATSVEVQDVAMKRYGWEINTPIRIQKLRTLDDFEAEVYDIQQYVNRTKKKMKDLFELSTKYFVY